MANAQTVLSPGDIAITGFSCDNPDQFVFVLLNDVETGTQIHFTDRGWDSVAGAFRAGEGTLTWTATSNLTAGTVVDILDLEDPFTADVGTVTDDPNFQLSGSGDQILAYQGNDTSPTFINAINMDGNDGGWSNATGQESTALPPGLTDGLNAMYFGEVDNGSFICPSDPIEATESTLISLIVNTNNWELENGPFTVTTTLGGGCAISIIVPCEPSPGSNIISGTVFNDYNKNGVLDIGEPLISSATVDLYSDLNGNGIIDGADAVLQTDVTSGLGEYSFSITPTVSTNQLFSKRIDQGIDDAQQGINNSVVLNGTEVKFKAGDPFLGTRFRGVDIPQGSVINNATVKFLSKDNQTGFLSYEISIEASDNASRFLSVNNNISNRWDPTNIVAWYNMPNWSELTIYSTPDISPLIQSVIDRPGWEPNNSIALIFGYFDGPNAERKTETYEKIGNQAALLEINYDAVDPASFIILLDEATVPVNLTLTTSNNLPVSFTSVDEVDCDNNFGLTYSCNDPSGVDTDGDGVNDPCDFDDDNDGILDVDECSDLAKIPILNSDFENVDIVASGLDGGPSDQVGSSGVWKGDANYVPNWKSADITNNHLEIWQNGHAVGDDAGGTAYSGVQWAEINATTNDGLYQDIITTPGDMLQWSFAHRKRLVHAGSGAEDVMRLLIGPPGGPLVGQGDFSTANDASWTFHSGTYTVPVGQTTTRLTFTALSTVSGSLSSGNFIDNVQFYVIPNCEDTDSDTIADYLDIDSDDDGIPDNVEAQSTLEYLAPTGLVNTLTGVYPNYTSGLTLIDTDSDGIYDFRDPDSDADGTPDIEENGMADIAGASDTDSDGLKDIFETNGFSDAVWDINEDIEDPADLTILPDTDNDRYLGGDLDYRDLLDSNLPAIAKIDFDGIDDYIELTTSPINTLDEFTVSFWFKLDEVLTAPWPAKTFLIGQKEMFEVSVGLGVSGDPYLYTTHYYGTGPSGQSVGHQINSVNWIHYTAIVNYNTENIRVYINGEQKTGLGMSGNPRLTNSNPFRIGSKLDVQPDPDHQNFKGWVDEIRIFNGSLTTNQIQQMVYQEIENNAGVTHGVTIDKDIEDPTTQATIPWIELLAYYPMNYIYDYKVKDMSLYGNNARLYNITTVQPQNAPMPYVTSSDGDWTAEATWLHGDVWDIEDIPNNKDWSIVHIKNDVSTSASHTQLGMIIDSGSTLTVSGDNEINNNWYFQLDGTLDLADDSQLIQTETSDLVTSAAGKILRRQEGNADKHWYNYWSSPVGSLAATTLSDNNGASNNTNNTPFSINMLKDGTGANIQFTNQVDETGKISTQWLYTFQNGLTYYNWLEIDQNTSIAPGFGYTQKGTGNAGTEQQYIFEGKPNNGTILIAADDVDGDAAGVGESVQDVTFTTSLIGNPYPSALDAEEFIRDNIDFDNGFANPIIQGTILLWEQWAGSSHYLNEYEGGYGYINLTETERAYQHPNITISDPTNPDNRGIKTPTTFIPVGQAFFVEVVNDGNIVFNNGQRIFKQEDLGESVFFRSSDETNTQAGTQETAAETQILRLEFGVSSGASRSFVIGFSEDATDGYDYGMDGGLINDPPEDDMGSLLNGQQYVIQAFAPYTPDKEIDLVLHASGNYTYTFKSTEISNFPADQDLFLKDLLTGQHYNLRNTEVYNFTSDAGSFTDRFKVVFQDPEALSTEEFTTDNTLIYVNQPEKKLYVLQLTEQARELSISNMLGQRIKALNSVDNQTLENGIDISGLSSGIYIVSIKTENNLSIDKKVIIN